MRLDHLLSKERRRAVEEVGAALLFGCQGCKWPVRESVGEERLTGDIAEILVAMRPGDTPVLIPNTKVKTRAADGTMLETAWESRWLPDQNGLIAQPVRAHA